MVHAPAAEKKAVADGWATSATLIGSNEFYIVGPTKDPAGIAQGQERRRGLRADRQRPRPSSSRAATTPARTRRRWPIWEKAGIKPARRLVRHHQGLHDGHPQARRRRTGLLHDRQQHLGSARKEMKTLKILFKGDVFLVNTYHTLCQPAGRHPGPSDCLSLHRLRDIQRGASDDAHLRSRPIRRRHLQRRRLRAKIRPVTAPLHRSGFAPGEPRGV